MIEDVNNFNVLTDTTESQIRQSLCNACTENTTIQNSRICNLCACPIDYVITYKFKRCPLNKWSID